MIKIKIFQTSYSYEELSAKKNITSNLCIQIHNCKSIKKNIALFCINTIFGKNQEVRLDDLFVEIEIKELREKIAQHNDLYYKDNQPEISDFEFDKLVIQLRELEKQYPQYLKKTI